MTIMIKLTCLQGRIFLMTEAISQFCRGLAPIQPWLVFLLDSYSGSEKVILASVDSVPF